MTIVPGGGGANAFDAGNAAFMRNWPYAYATSQARPVKGKFDVTVLPHRPGAASRSATVGGWQLGVSRSTRSNRAAAIELVRYLTSARRSRSSTPSTTRNVPTIPAVAQRPGRRQGEPVAQARDRERRARDAALDSWARKYQQGSQIIYQGINQILNGQDAKNVLPGIAAAAQPPAPLGASADEPSEGGWASAPSSLVVRGPRR